MGLHIEIQHWIYLSNNRYQMAANEHHRPYTFEKEELVLVRVNPEGLATRANWMLHARYIRPYMVLWKIGANAYVWNLPDDIYIGPIFNVTDLFPYHTPILHEDDNPIPELSNDTLPAYSLEENFPHPRGINVEKNLRSRAWRESRFASNFLGKVVQHWLQGSQPWWESQPARDFYRSS